MMPFLNAGQTFNANNHFTGARATGQFFTN